MPAVSGLHTPIKAIYLEGDILILFDSTDDNINVGAGETDHVIGKISGTD